jgi:hypothetical protein
MAKDGEVPDPVADPKQEVPAVKAPDADKDQAEVPPKPGDENIVNQQITPEQAAALDRLLAQAAGTNDRMPPFFSSGVFFMLIGAVLLGAAYLTMGGTHSTFTFVLVVVGVAILLYGTGTQGVAQFTSNTGSAAYKGAIAGGAGLLAFLIGYGIVERYPAIQDAFQVERKYLRYRLNPQDDGASNFANYAAVVDVNGEQVPAFNRGRAIEVHIPYFLGEKGMLRGTIWLHRITEEATNQMPLAKAPIEIDLASMELNFGDGADLPMLDGAPDSLSVKLPNSLEATNRDKQEVATGVALPPPLATTQAF